ncbi:hypothetical protein ANANG_G00004720 [Anguilla anguilla]|uniref:Uncharacterized protein n=1 Tax=Anguilla anguilla TaxID=7936 RepID=A0A9D3MWI2_ANGAN|nr:hypothetical protein ANANG_G00004720 [Anguilla anguilla]
MSQVAGQCRALSLSLSLSLCLPHRAFSNSVLLIIKGLSRPWHHLLKIKGATSRNYSTVSQ